MTLPQVVSWLTTPELTAVANTATISGFVLAVVCLVLYLQERYRKRTTLLQIPTAKSTQSQMAPRTWWEYLTNDLKLSLKARKACAALYDSGWEQLNRPTNNREEAIGNAEAQLREISTSLSREEIALAERLSVELASNPDNSSRDVEARLRELSPGGQSCVRLHATIRKIEQDMAVDLVLGIPLTDYREVKKALKEETPPAHILDQLPLAWKMIRTINDPVHRRKEFRKAVRPKRIRLTVHTENGEKKDDRAELDEDWVISDKLDMLLPFTGITFVYQMVEWGSPPVLKDRRMVFGGPDPPGTESKYWTRGGRADRVLARAARGEDPEQLRKEARRRKLRLAFLYSSMAFLAASILFRIVESMI